MLGTPLYKLSNEELQAIVSGNDTVEDLTWREKDQRRHFANMILLNRTQQKANPSAFTHPNDR